MVVLGSIPTAFLGVFCCATSGVGLQVGDMTKGLGWTLLVVVTALVVKAWLLGARSAGGGAPRDSLIPFEVKTPADVADRHRRRPDRRHHVGRLGIAHHHLLMMILPADEASELVGTDLVQAVPLVASAALGHLLFGGFKLGLTASILIGASRASSSGRASRRARPTT